MKKKKDLFALARDCANHSKKQKGQLSADSPNRSVSSKESMATRPTSQTVEGQHYDSGEPMSLNYGDNEYNDSFSAKNTVEYLSYEELPNNVRGMGADDFVEPFESETQEPFSSSPDHSSEGKETKKETNDMPQRGTQNAAERIAGKTEKDSTSNKNNVSDPAPADLLLPEEKDSFEDDIKAILSGKKKYDPKQKGVVSSSRESNQSTRQKGANPFVEPEAQMPDFKKNEHDIFNKIAQNLSYSNTYDLGAIALDNRFDFFDKEFDKEQAKKKVTP